MNQPLQGRGGSLQRTLLAWLLLPLVALVPLAAAVVYQIAVKPALDGLDRALTDTAVALHAILTTEGGRAQLPLTEQTVRALTADLVDEVAFAVGDERQGLLGGDAQLLALRPPLQAGEWVFFDGQLRGREMRMAAFGAACGTPPAVCPILVAESLGKRRGAERAVAAAALAAALLLAGSLGLLALLAVRRGLQPLREASAEIESRSLQQLQPLSLAAAPREAESFVRALNDLFERLRTAASAQRAFVADAAHQLRTPLTTLLVESTQALAQPHPPALQPTLHRLHAAAERGARLTQQLLTLARTEGTALDTSESIGTVDLATLATEAADLWLHASLAAGQDLGFELHSARVSGHPLLLQEALGNLVHNAIQHAGRGARVTVRTRCEGTQAVLEVEDNGPGLAPEESERAWDRFHRGRGAQGPGTGLGLAIVRDIARLHRGEATLGPGRGGNGSTGLCVRLALPLAGAEAVGNLS